MDHDKMPGRTHRPPGSATVWTQACLEKYHKSYASGSNPTDADTVPAPMLFRRKCPAADTPPASWKRAYSAKIEDQMCLANVAGPLFLANPEELSYPDKNEEQPREATQYSPSSSIWYLPISRPNTPAALVSHGD